MSIGLAAYCTETLQTLEDLGILTQGYKLLTQVERSAMQKTAEDILRCHRAKEVDGRLLPIKDIITLIDEL